MSTWDKLEWDDIADLASSLFWMAPGSGLTWAEVMWKYLAKARLTRYQTELERCQVKIYVMALADIYSEFCHMAHEEPRDEEYCDWAEALELSPFRIGQLVGSETNFEPDETNDQVLMEAALSSLISSARDRTLVALSKHFGSALRLLQSLDCCSTGRYEDESSIKEANLDLSFENMRLYSWIEEEISTAKDRVETQKRRSKSKATSVNTGDVQLSLSI